MHIFYIGRKHQLITRSGSRTGVDSPHILGVGQVQVGRDRVMSTEDFNESNRYFMLFKQSIEKYSDGCSLAYNDTTGECSVLAGNFRTTFKFPFDVATIKNHYCEYRIASDMDVYLAIVRSKDGVRNYFNPTLHPNGLITPPALGNFQQSYHA